MRAWVVGAICVWWATIAVGGPPNGAEELLARLGTPGGLIVQLGAADMELALAAARTGRYLVQVLEPESGRVDAGREQLQAQDAYGLVTLDHLEPGGTLPYAENLVNLVIVADQPGCYVRPEELARVVCPLGKVLSRSPQLGAEALQKAGFADVRPLPGDPKSLVASKPWPAEMDQWPQPRRAADANAVSRDKLVGPPRRIRWVAGPQQEISNLVSAAGRNFYAGVLARDAFNGLRLWQRRVSPSPARGGFNFKAAKGSMQPIAVDGRLLALESGTLVALSGATGRPVQQYPQAGQPQTLLYEDGRLLAVDEQSLRAIDVASGTLQWKHAATQPRAVVAGDGGVYFLQGDPKRGVPVSLTRLSLDSGLVVWRQSQADWLGKVRACVYQSGRLACEISTLNNDGPGNRVEVLSADDGRPIWDRDFVPGMAHQKQARAFFLGDQVWLLDDHRSVAVDCRNGLVRRDFPAGWGHCFPPVATERYLFSGEMDMIDLATGLVDANRITKGSCSRDAGWIPANGLIYTSPKHCTCWPMLRDYSALAAARPGARPSGQLDEMRFVTERGPAPLPAGGQALADSQTEWPCYRHDAWRSGSTAAAVPAHLKVRWQLELGAWPAGTIADDWREDSFVKAPLTPPVVACGMVFVARPDAHQVVALDADQGTVRWKYTANGRIDTPPTIHRGLCLFGTRSGWVYALRADDGRLVWRLRVGPAEERIVAYGQVESPWPVPGSLLVVDDVLYLAAGRQPLADGGILVLAVSPATGRIRWAQRLTSVPQTDFYASSALEFDNFDLLVREGDAVAMSRWVFDSAAGRMTCKAKSGFAHLTTGGSGVLVPRGCWSYAPRQEDERVKERPYLRAPVVFRDNTLYGCTEDRKQLFRRDFDLAGGEKFDDEWFSRWKAVEEARKGGLAGRNQRLAKGARWTVKPLEGSDDQPHVDAMVLTRDAIFIAGARGGLAAISLADGSVLARCEFPAPVWDGLAAAEGRLYVSLKHGEVVCLE